MRIQLRASGIRLFPTYVTTVFWLMLWLTGSPVIIAQVTEHRIDKRNATDSEGNYYVIFCARKSSEDKAGVGHAFVVWAQENERKRYSTSEAFGFYPESDKKFGLFGPVPGELKNEATQRDASKLQFVTHRMTVQVNKQQWQASQARIKQWNTTNYSLFHQNCVSFTYDVASDLSLVVKKPDSELPSHFLARLIEASK